MNFAKRAIVFAGTLSLLTACGEMKQDATAKYLTVEKEAGPAHNQQYVVQEGLGSAAFSISLSKAEFTVGELGSHTVTVKASKGLSYDLNLKSQPQGMELTKQAEGVYALTWTPSEKAVPLYKSQGKMDVKIVLSYNEAASSAEVVKALRDGGVSLEHTVNVTVNRPAGQASIKFSGNEIPATIEEGKSLAFSVEVSDPTTQQQPKVEFIEVGTGAINGSLLIATDLKNGLKKNQNGTYTLTGILTADVKQLPTEVRENLEKSNGSLKIQFGFAVISAATGASIETATKTVTLQLDKSASAPEIKIVAKSKTAARGKKNTVTIMAVSQNSRANTNIDIAKLKASLADATTGLPGKAEITGCKEDNQTPVHTCTLNWTVACDTADLKAEYTVNVEAASVLFGESKSATQSQTLKLAPVCPKPVAKKKTTTKKPVSKKPVTTSTAPTAGGNK